MLLSHSEGMNMKRKDVVRLGGAVFAAVAVAFWGIAYNDSVLNLVLPCNFSEDRLNLLPTLTRLCYEARWFWLAVPMVLGVAGIWALKRNRPTLLQWSVTLSWLLSILWVLFIQWVWLLPLLPLCSPIEG